MEFAPNRYSGVIAVKIPTASRVLNHARPATVAPFRDEDIVAACEQCAVETKLSDCRIEDTERAKNYRCGTCDDILVITRAPNSGGKPIADSGYRLGDWVFANAVDVRIEGLDRLSFPAMRNATTVEIRTKDGGGIDDAR